MEALGIQVDQLKWENHQLKAENQKLRENNVEQAAPVDLEWELEMSKSKLTELEEWSKVAASKSYTGGELNLIGQPQIQLTTISHAVDMVVQVQKDAPADLLLGTDVQPALGFSLIQCDSSGTASDLTKEGLKWNKLASRTDTLLSKVDPKPQR